MDVIFLNACISLDRATLYRTLGPYQLAWYLRENGYQAQVLDFVFKFTDEEIMQLLKKYITRETKIVGIGMMIGFDHPNVASIARKFENIFEKIKIRYPWVTTVVGGSAGPNWARENRNKRIFDYVLTGYAENTILALCDHLAKGAPRPQFEMLNGNRFIKDSFIMPGGNRFSIESSRHQWHRDDYIQPGETLPLELGRGCIFKCKFCRYPHIGKKKNDFRRSMECIKEELVSNYENWQVTNYYMLDDTFNADQNQIREFAEMVKTLPFRVRYITYLRPDLLHSYPESVDLLLESGLGGAYLGVETLHEQAGKVIDKPWGARHAREFLPTLYHKTWNRQVAIKIGFICGLPPETFDSCLETNKWMIESEFPDWVWYPLGLVRDNHTEHLSEFDRNAADYGFEWMVHEGKLSWKTAYCTSPLAKEWKDQLRNQAKPYIKYSSWELFELANYGYDIDQTMKLHVLKTDWKQLASRRDTWLQTYYNQLLGQTPGFGEMDIISVFETEGGSSILSSPTNQNS